MPEKPVFNRPVISPLEKCRWCDERAEMLPIAVVMPDRNSPAHNVIFKFDKLRCVAQWAILQGWPK